MDQHHQQQHQHIDLVNKKYKLYKTIGKGSFGTIYLGKNIKTGENVAIKMEYNGSHSLLKHEAKILKYLNERGEINIPSVYWFGPYGENITLVMPFYEYSLQDEFLNDKRYNTKEMDMICLQLVKTLEYIHSKYVLHRDLKPQNIMVKSGRMYIIDFGFSTFYIDEYGEHVKNRDRSNETILGSPRYTSWNIHNGHTPARRDDLISLGYIYLLLTTGSSPIGKEKSFDAIHSMDSINGINNIIMLYFDHCYQLDYNETPNYDGIYQIFHGSSISNSLTPSTIHRSQS